MVAAEPGLVFCHQLEPGEGVASPHPQPPHCPGVSPGHVAHLAIRILQTLLLGNCKLGERRDICPLQTCLTLTIKQKINGGSNEGSLGFLLHPNFRSTYTVFRLVS